MRLLYIVPYAPTPIRTRPYHLIRELVRCGHQVTLATLQTDEIEDQALARWRAAGVQVLAARLSKHRALLNVAQAFFTRAPLQAAFCWQPALMRMLRDSLAQTSFDAVHVEHLRGAWYGLRVHDYFRKHNQPTPVIWDSVDCITHLFEQTSRESVNAQNRLIARFELGRTRAYEKNLAHTFARTIVVSENERVAFCEIMAGDCERVSVVPLGVDIEYFTPPSSPRESATVLFSGKMSYHANVTAARYLLDEIMPRVWQALPETHVEIVGQNPPPTLTARASARVTVTGYVPDVRPYLNHATVACTPLRYGAGTQNKVLEAMASGLAVVATPAAVAALAAQPQRDLLVAADSAQLSAQLVRVLQDAKLRERLQQNGRRYVETYHQWSASVRVLQEIYVRAHQDTARASGA